MTDEGLTGVARGRCVAVFAYGVGGLAPGGDDGAAGMLLLAGFSLGVLKKRKKKYDV